MEKSTKTTYRIFQVATILFLSSGFAMAKSWLGVIIVLLMVPSWQIPLSVQRKIVSRARLVMFVGIAAYGLSSNASSYLMIASVATALACWEFEDQIPNEGKSSIPLNAWSYEKTHLQKLGLAIGAGFILAEAGLFLNFSLPFVVVFLVAILVLFCIFQLSVIFKKVKSK